MTLKQLTYFLEIAKMKNFTKAAANLYISQSALSKTVKAMESELGVQLIDRTVNHFKLTPEGEIFLSEGPYRHKKYKFRTGGPLWKPRH